MTHKIDELLDDLKLLLALLVEAVDEADGDEDHLVSDRIVKLLKAP